MCCVSKLAVKRESLIEVSRMARSLRSEEAIDGTINYVLLNYIYDTGDANEFKTFEEWQAIGYGVRKGVKAFITWGKPRKRVNKRGKEMTYFPVRHLFSDKQVYRMKEGNMTGITAERGNFVGEIKVSFVKSRKVKYRDVSTSDRVANVFSELWESNQIEYRESIYVLALNNNYDVLGYAKLFEGGLNASIVDERVIFQLLLNANASGFIIAHNHPSGSIKPSNEDMKMTKRLKQCADLMDIKFLDHLIMTGDKAYFSFSDNGLI